MKRKQSIRDERNDLIRREVAKAECTTKKVQELERVVWISERQIWRILTDTTAKNDI